MTLCRFEIHFGGEIYSFNDPGRFLLWLPDRGNVSNEDVYLRGVLVGGEEGSPEVTTFFRKELRLAPTLVVGSEGPSGIFVVDVDIDLVRRGQFVRLVSQILQAAGRAEKRS